MAIVINPQSSPYQFWSHVWGLIEARNDATVPEIGGFLPGRDLALIVQRRRGGTIQNASRTARLILNRWEPGILGERQSRPGFQELADIWQEAATRSGVFDTTWWIEDDVFTAEMTQKQAYRIPTTAVVSSINPVEPDEIQSEGEFYRVINNYKAGDATFYYAISPVTRRGEKYVLSCWLAWESRRERRINTENFSRMPGN